MCQESESIEAFLRVAKDGAAELQSFQRYNIDVGFLSQVDT
jgi:hypothetical protein